jgi:polygalacturonase
MKKGLYAGIFILLSLHAVWGTETGWALTYNVREFGAAGDGSALDSRAIQSAVDACSGRGGGTVYFPPGRYLSGTVTIKSNVTLHLEAGATLLGSVDLKDYPPLEPAFRSYANVNYVNRSLIYAEKAENIAIIGRGTINGQGGDKAFALPGSENYKKRPYLIRFIECRGVKVRDVTLTDSPMWVQHYLACENVVVDGVKVHSQVNKNNDGIDVDCCRSVMIANCDIVSGDDVIVLKSTALRLCENVTVTNCVLSGKGNGFKLGTESVGGFRDIAVSNCAMYDCTAAGVAIEMVDGGTIERVCVTNVTMRNVEGGIFIRLGNRARPYLAEGPGGSVGTWHLPAGVECPMPGMGALQDVTISNILATGCDHTGCSITGLADHPVRNITLNNVRLEFAGGGTAEWADAAAVPEKAEGYPSYTMLGHLPCYGMFVRHAENIIFNNVQLSYQTPEVRPAMICDDIRDLTLTSLRAQPPAPGRAVVRFNNVANALINACLIDPAANPFLLIDGKKSRQITLLGNNTPESSRVIQLGIDVESETVHHESLQK